MVKILSLMIVLLLFVSGPLYVPMLSYSTPVKADSSLESSNSITDTAPEEPQLKPRKYDATLSGEIRVEASQVSGDSPLYIEFRGVTPDLYNGSKPQQYEWDFTGDGVADYICYESLNATRVFEQSERREIVVSLTVVYENGILGRNNVTIVVDPIRELDWLEMRDLGDAKVGVRKNGTIIIYDSVSWLPLSFSKYDEKLSNPTLTKLNDGASRITYSTKKTRFDVTLEYGVAGRVFFNFTEYLPKGSSEKAELLTGPTMPNEKKTGSISFQYEEAPPITSLNSKKSQNVKKENLTVVPVLEKSQIVSPVKVGLRFTQPSEGTGNVWGSGGAAYNPWRDQGLTPYGEYFKNLQEYVSSETGFLTVSQTDLQIPGRGLDLTIKKVYSPPSTFEDGLPASAPDYNYRSNPAAPFGNSWELGLPWIELSTGGYPAYIHLSDGQRYQWAGCVEYHYGDHFKIYGHMNGTFSLYTVDGIRYRFNNTYKLVWIDDPSGNCINIIYSGGRISAVRDTINRTITLSYNDDGYISSIISANRTTRYYYEIGQVGGYKLVKIQDPDNRNTTIRYYNDYLINKIEYPTGGYSAYEYVAYTSSGYTRYRVVKQLFFDGSTIAIKKTFEYGGGYASVTTCIVREYENSIIKKTTTLDYQTSGVIDTLFMTRVISIRHESI